MHCLDYPRHALIFVLWVFTIQFLIYHYLWTFPWIIFILDPLRWIFCFESFHRINQFHYGYVTGYFMFIMLPVLQFTLAIIYRVLSIESLYLVLLYELNNYYGHKWLYNLGLVYAITGWYGVLSVLVIGGYMYSDQFIKYRLQRLLYQQCPHTVYKRYIEHYFPKQECDHTHYCVVKDVYKPPFHPIESCDVCCYREYRFTWVSNALLPYLYKDIISIIKLYF